MAKRGKKDFAQDTVLAVHAHLIIKQGKAVDAAKKKLQTIEKIAEQNGAPKSDIRAAIKFYREDPNERQARMQRFGKILSAVRAPGVQLNFFDKIAAKPIVTTKKAHDEGFFAFINCGEPTPPYGPGTEEGQAWLKGWHEAAGLVAEHERSIAEQTSAGESEDKSWPDDDDVERRADGQTDLEDFTKQTASAH